MRLGLLGGSFDPPHVAHLIVAEVARVDLGLDRVLFVVAGRPWMKSHVTPARHRLAMTRLATVADQAFEVDDREIHREGPTYTIDTVEELLQERPGAELMLIVGADQLRRLDDWKATERLRDLVRLAVAPRPGHGLPSDVAAERLDAPVMAVSSTDLRERFARGAAVRHQLPRGVEAYVRRHGLYGTGADG